MQLDDVARYVNQCENAGMTKIKITMEAPEEVTGFYVTQTEETYVFTTESEADSKINEARQNSGFASATKKYKAGKLNKAGDEIKPETWTVVIKLNH